MHDATNVGSEPSLHITVGLLVKKWADLMLEVLSEVALNNSEFRESLRVGFAKKDFDMSNARTDFRKLVETFANEADFDNVFNMFKKEYYRTRKPNLKGALMQSSVGIETGTSYRLRENFQFAIKAEGEQTVVSCAGGDLKFSASSEAGLRFILEGNSFDTDHFSDLPNDEGKEIIEKLIAFGVIELSY